MGDGLRPQNMPQWMRWVEGRLRRLDARISSRVAVPVGAAVLWTGTGSPPGPWLLANGGTFDGTVYPDLQVVLGGTTLPTLTAVSGRNWYVRAE